MSSPITFSGFNSIDFNQILNAIMTAERAPMTALETQVVSTARIVSPVGVMRGTICPRDITVNNSARALCASG